MSSGLPNGDARRLKVEQLKRSVRQFAFKPVRPGTYSVYFDTTGLFSDSTYDSPGYRRVVVRRPRV